jgi:DNA-binding GntR family transcriptional regulator
MITSRSIYKMSDVKNKKESLAEEAVVKLKEAVISGDLRPNQRLIEVQLSRKFGMSRTPIREAIRRLQQTGDVTILPKGGAIVTEFSREHIIKQFEVREALETLVVKLDCERSTAEQISRARKYLEMAAVAAARHDLDEYDKYEAMFRDIILEACGNDRLITLVKTTRSYNYLARLAHVISDAELSRNIRLQFKLMNSISERNKAGAASSTKKILRLLGKIALARL